MSILAARFQGASGDLRRVVALGPPGRPWAVVLPSVARVVAIATTLVGAIGAVMLLVAVHSHIAGDALGLLRSDAPI
jgi:hypothetical protein